MLVDGVVAEILSFEGASVAAAAPEGEEGERAAQQAVHPFTLSFNSAEYDAVTGEPTYMNGERTISAELMVVGSDEPITSGFHAHEFANDDGVQVAVSGLGAGALNSATGQMWYGGPAAKIEITAVPVLYSGGSVSSVGIGAFCGAEAATDAEAPFKFTPKCEGTSNTDAEAGSVGATPAFTIAAADVDVLNGDMFPLYLDYQGPSAPTFYPNPNDREGGWVNATVDFLGKQGSKNKNGWLTYTADDAGVGGYTTLLRAAPAPSGMDGLKEALAAPILTPATLPGESKANAYCVVASAVDLLGNQSALPDPDEGDECLTAEAILATGMMAVEDDPDTANEDESMDAVPVMQMSAIRAGVDLTPPTVVFTGASTLKANATSLEVSPGDLGSATTQRYQLHVTDNQDVHVAEPILDTLEIRGADGNTKGAVTTLDDTQALPVANVQFAPSTMGYYTYAAQAQDAAGNLSEWISRVALHDTSPPVAALILTKGKDAFNYDKILVTADNLSLRDYSVVISGPTGITPVRLKLATLDGYNDGLTQNKTVSGPVELPFIAVRATAGGGVVENNRITTLTTYVTDQAGNSDNDPGTVTVAVGTGDDDDLNSDEDGIIDGEYAVKVEDDGDGTAVTDVNGTLTVAKVPVRSRSRQLRP